MAIINSSQYVYDASFADASFDIVLKLNGDFESEAVSFADSELEAIIELAGDFLPIAFSPGNTSFAGAFKLAGNITSSAAFEFGIDLAPQLVGDFAPDTALALQNPAPITNTVAPGAFTHQRYAAPRLYINNVLTPFISAEINASGKSLGKSLKIELTRADLAQLPAGATFKFQIGKIVAGVTTWTTILDGGKLAGRSYSVTVGRDSLSFSTVAGTDKLDKCPKNNFIVYDPLKTSVSIDEIEAIPTNTGEFVGTSKLAVGVLSLWKLLNIAFVEGCNFAGVQTDIPNYEIARCDFSVAQTYVAAVAQFIGVFEPEFSLGADGKLMIQKTVNPLPDDYEPNQITASRLPSFTESAEYPSANIDGYILQFMGTGGMFFVDRSDPPLVEQIGDAEFGDPDFVEQTTNRKFRDWFEQGDPVAARTELKEEVIETRRNGILTGREVKTNKFDVLGRSKGYTNTIETRLPDVGSGGTPALLKTHEESQKIVYKSNPFAPRQTILSRIETAQNALLAIDAENTALDMHGADSAYGQDYEKVFDSGNLRAGMTSEFKTLDVTVEQFRPLPSGQIEYRLGGFDYLRGKPKKPITDTRGGDISVQNFQKQKTKTIFAPGVTQENRTGKPLIPLNAGELPLFFAEPLADWLLANGRISANVEVTGYDESIERGISFNLRGRSGEDLGNFLISGYRVLIQPLSIKTILDALKV